MTRDDRIRQTRHRRDARVRRVEGPRSDSGVTIVEEGEIYSPVFRFVGRYVIGHDATLQAALAELRASF